MHRALVRCAESALHTSSSEASVYDYLFLSTQIIHPAPHSPLVRRNAMLINSLGSCVAIDPPATLRATQAARPTTVPLSKPSECICHLGHSPCRTDLP